MKVDGKVPALLDLTFRGSDATNKMTREDRSTSSGDDTCRGERGIRTGDGELT